MRSAGSVWIVVLLATLAGLGVLAWFFVALPTGAGRPDEFAEIDRLAGERAGVPEAERDRPNAAHERLERAMAGVERAHATALGRPVRTGDVLDWGQAFPDRVLADAASREEALRVIAAMEAEGVWTELAELSKEPRVFAPFPRRRLLTSTVDDSMPVLRQWSRVHSGAARLAMEAGRTGEAVAYVERNLLLSRVIASRPGLMMALVSQAVGVMALNDAVAIAMSEKATPDDRAALAGAMENAAELDVAYALAVERQWTLRTIGELLGSTPLVPINRGAQQAKIDEIHERYAAAMAEPEGPARLARAREAEAWVSGLGMRYRVAQMHAEGLGRIVETGLSGRARREIARVMVASARFRADSRAWPSSPADLVPKYLSGAAIDPFSGRPLGMRADPAARGGLLVWSAGPDGDDDQGRPAAKGVTAARTGPPDGDLVLEWGEGWAEGWGEVGGGGEGPKSR